MMRLLRIAICVIGMTGLVASSARADVMYTVKDVGTDNDVFVGLNNLSGRRNLQIDAAGAVTLPASDRDPTSYTGPIPTGMRPLNDYYPHTSTDGQYLVGTAFANHSPVAFWAGFIVHDGVSKVMDTLGDPASTWSEALAVNNSGTVVGTSGFGLSGANHALVINASGKMIDLGTLGGGITAALGINNEGTIVGEGSDTSGPFRAFVSNGHTLTDLNKLIAPIAGFSLISATAINDSGQIAAYGRFASDPDGLYHELLLSPSSLNIPSLLPVAAPATDPTPPVNPQPSPIPEPTTLALFSLIAGAVGMRARRQRAMERQVSTDRDVTNALADRK